MKKRIVPILLVLTLGVMIFSCRTNGSSQPDIPDLNAIRTEAVSTYAFSLTGTLAPVPTVTFTQTSLATFTASALTLTAETAVPVNTCYNLLWIEDVTIPDGTQMKGNEVFTKTWRVQNNGSCAWAPGFAFRHAGGDPMRGESLILQDPIPVGAKRELSIDLVAPGGQTTGLVQSSWRMADANGNFFGDTLSVNIIVGNASTPAVTSTP
jgi:hypothetical protein